MFKRIAMGLAALALAVPAAVQAQAPAWPTAKPITIIVPFSAGGSVDAAARLVAQKLSERLKQSVVVENVAGAGGTIGITKAVNAAPDGYTLVMGADSPIAIARQINPAAVKYDSLKDLAPVGLVNTAPMVLVARPGLPANTLAEVLKLAKEQPGKLSYATSGIGTVLHLAMELIKDQAKVYITHVPYRGGAQIVADVVGNQVDLGLLVSVTATPQIQAKKLKGIAVTDDKRLPTLPNVPAVAETPGFKGFDMVAWTGLFAPANTPAAVVERLNRELNEVLKSDEVRSKMQEQGAVGGSGSAAEFAAVRAAGAGALWADCEEGEYQGIGAWGRLGRNLTPSLHTTTIAKRTSPAAIKPIPSPIASRSPPGAIFSTATTIDSAAIQARFITPPTNSSAISAQQQPTHSRPWRTPIANAPPTPGRHSPIRNTTGVRQPERHTRFSGEN